METISREPSATPRRKFDKTFKCGAVRNWLGTGQSAAVVAKELGRSESPLFAQHELLPPADAGGERRLRTPAYHEDRSDGIGWECGVLRVNPG